jgi:acetyl esterase/lipase
MKYRTIMLLAGAAVLAAGIAQAKPGDRLRERIAERRAAQGGTGGADDTMIERSGRADQTGTKVMYGSDAAQRVLVWPAKDRAGGSRPPLAVFIHGGGWQKGFPELVDNKPAWFKEHGWAFASIGYRLLPDSPVEEQARDVGRALAKLRAEAAKFGYNPDRILLFGHSAGAHLTALVSSDPQYAGNSFAAIKAAILIDGACYDVPRQIESSAWMAKRTYIPAFGEDPARQRALSPITHAGGRDVGDWLLLYTSARDDAQAQSEALAAALRRGGTLTELVKVPSTKRNPLAGHLEINKEFGTSGYAANPQIEAIMRRVAK